ncbi:MAG: hypothetical protein ACRDHF_04940 [Tepidiformaceae bacterium]
MSGLQVVTTTNTLTSNSSQVHTALCPAGKLAIGGGASIVNGNNSVALTDSRPALVTGSPNGWFARAIEIGDYASNWGITVYVICANVS